MLHKKRWFYVHEGHRFGPVTAEALHNLAEIWQIERNDLVWSDGMKDWIPADTVPGLLPDNAESRVRQSAR